MDINQFSDASPGKIVPIGEGRHSFIPDPLPAIWEIPSAVWKALAEASSKLGVLEGVGRNLPNPMLLLPTLQNREALESSALEGTYATAEELLMFDPEENPNESSSRREVWNYRDAMRVARNSDLPVCLRLVRMLHEALMRGIRGHEKSPGEFRKGQVAIGRDERFVPPPPNLLNECLDHLEKYFHASEDLHPLIRCFLVHYQFETIHPFTDGNGRVGRVLLSHMIQQECNLSKPWLYLSGFFEGNRDEYSGRLFDVSVKGDWSGWVEFCLRGVTKQATATVEKCDRLRAIRDEFMKKAQGRPRGTVRLTQIIDRLFHSPFVSITDLHKRLNVSYATAKSDVAELMKLGVLEELPNTRPKAFFSNEVFKVAYDRD
ncbi:MAG: Fic family protein [Planctomycetales bacterium]